MTIMKQMIVKANCYKAITRANDEKHVKFHSLVVERLTSIYSDMLNAPARIAKEWKDLSDALDREVRKHTMWERHITPEIVEKRKERDKLIENVIEYADFLAKFPDSDAKSVIGYQMQRYLVRLKLLRNDSPNEREVGTSFFCRWVKEMPEYASAVQSGLIDDVVDDLNKVNNDCDNMLHDSWSKLYNEIPEDMKQLRIATDTAYRELIEQTNETLTELTMLSEDASRSQTSAAEDASTAVEDAARITALVKLLNADVAQYEQQAADARMARKQAAERKRRKKGK